MVPFFITYISIFFDQWKKVLCWLLIYCCHMALVFLMLLVRANMVTNRTFLAVVRFPCLFQLQRKKSNCWETFQWNIVIWLLCNSPSGDARRIMRLFVMVKEIVGYHWKRHDFWLNCKLLKIFYEIPIYDTEISIRFIR